MSNSKWKINYADLGGVDSKKKFYSEGEEIVHPSGVKYVRRNGNWVIKGSDKDVKNSEQPS
jgi:hypothetical protein